MMQLDEQLEARPTSFRQERSGKHLFVWGDIGRWLVVDAEAAALIDQFAAKRAVGDVLQQLARVGNQPFEDVVATALPVIEALKQRDVLAASAAVAPPPEERPRVSNLTFNITNRCNLQCSWCYNPRTQREEVPIECLLAWLDAATAALDREAAFIILGGEPFLDQRRLLSTVRGVRERLSGELLVSTNGTRLSERTPAELAAAATTVQVSLDSPHSQQHDAIRGPGVFDLAIRHTRRLVDAGVHTVFSMVLTQSNWQEIESYFELAIETGVQEVRFIPLRQIGCGVGHANIAPDLYACFRHIVEILQRRPELSKLLHRDFFSILMTACRFSRLRNNCGVARRCVFVDANGEIFPCPNHRGPEHSCGNLRERSLDEVMQRTPVLAQLRSQYNCDNMPACSRCAFRYWCAGDCRAEALATGGVPDAPSPYCRQLQRIIPEMFWMIAAGWNTLGGAEDASRLSAGRC